MSAIPAPIPEIPTIVNSPTTVPTSSTPTPEKPSPTATAPSASSEPSPIHQQIEPTDVSPLSAYQNPYLGEAEEKEREEKESEGEEEKSEETPVAKPTPQENDKEEKDLNETARKQGLMTDDEFQSILDGVNMMEVDTAEMAEGLDLASKAVEGGEASAIENESEGVIHQSVEGVEEEQTEEERQKSVTPQSGAGEGDERTQEKEPEVQTKEPEQIVPAVSKPKAVKRKLVLKNDPKAERQKSKRVSQRCLGRWTSSKAGANTAADAVEISSEEERTTPTKPWEGTLISYQPRRHLNGNRDDPTHAE